MDLLQQGGEEEARTLREWYTLPKAEGIGLPLTTCQVSPSPFLQRKMQVQPKGKGR